MDLEMIYESIREVTKEDLKNVQLEDMQKIHPSLDLENPLTYIVYMDRRPDLTSDQRELVWKIVDRLNGNNNVVYEDATAGMDVAGTDPEYVDI